MCAVARRRPPSQAVGQLAVGVSEEKENSVPNKYIYDHHTYEEIFNIWKFWKWLQRGVGRCASLHSAAQDKSYGTYIELVLKTSIASPVCLFVSHLLIVLRPMGLSVLGYQSHLLQRCHPVTVNACGHEGSSHLSPVPALRIFIAMRVRHSYNSSTNND